MGKNLKSRVQIDLVTVENLSLHRFTSVNDALLQGVSLIAALILRAEQVEKDAQPFMKSYIERSGIIDSSDRQISAEDERMKQIIKNRLQEIISKEMDNKDTIKKEWDFEAVWSIVSMKNCCLSSAS